MVMIPLTVHFCFIFIVEARVCARFFLGLRSLLGIVQDFYPEMIHQAIKSSA